MFHNHAISACTNASVYLLWPSPAHYVLHYNDVKSSCRLSLARSVPEVPKAYVHAFSLCSRLFSVCVKCVECGSKLPCWNLQWVELCGMPFIFRVRKRYMVLLCVTALWLLVWRDCKTVSNVVDWLLTIWLSHVEVIILGKTNGIVTELNWLASLFWFHWSQGKPEVDLLVNQIAFIVWLTSLFWFCLIPGKPKVDFIWTGLNSYSFVFLVIFCLRQLLMKVLCWVCLFPTCSIFHACSIIRVYIEV